MSAEAWTTIVAIGVLCLGLVAVTVLAIVARVGKVVVTICIGCVLLIAAALVCFVGTVQDREKASARCEAAGGVLVRGSQPGTRVCVRGESLQ